jgi:tetratricopeptide (TPR) repeat protein
MRARWLLVALLAGPACSATSTPSTRIVSPRAPAPLAASANASPASPVFVEDDYPKALAQARALGKPLFVDAWAPWCHTCLSMRAYVFPNEAMRPLSNDFVWLAVDTERPENAAFLERFKMQVWPTLWVIDPKTETAALKWLGSATAKELASLLTDARSAVQSGSGAGEALAAFLSGQQASAAGKHEDAVRDYRAALEAAPPHWNKRAPTVEALVGELWEQKLDAACADTALAEMPKLPPGTSLANVGVEGLDCARRSPEGAPARRGTKLLARAVEQIALDESVPILADDRSGLFEATVDARMEDHDVAGARVLAAHWADYLERQARAAGSPLARAVFDAHRLLAYFALGDPGRALPMLEDSERDFPRDYNPPARMARVYLELKRYDDGLAAIGRAVSLGYGPRKVRLFLLRADLLAGKGDRAGSVATLREAETYAATLPAAEKSARDLAEIEKKLAGSPGE